MFRITAVALGAYVPSVELDEVTHDRQAEPKAALGAGARGICLTEAIEHEREKCRVDADTGIRDRQFELPVDDTRPNIHPAPLPA